jgi:hypothetical protein
VPDSLPTSKPGKQVNRLKTTVTAMDSVSVSPLASAFALTPCSSQESSSFTTRVSSHHRKS